MGITPVDTKDALMAPVADPGGFAKPRNTKQAAQQFEALLLTQMLKLARAGEQGWLGSGEDASSSTATEMAEQFLAQSLADNGGLGLAQLIQTGLEKP
ncbi:MAG TPA: hypothetical protein VHA11_13820 [Bryobacteraceae bacterium]|nr:hypothetical protein [Bryobacteraceae bacterium]